jgi:hypothetical protein
VLLLVTMLRSSARSISPSSGAGGAALAKDAVLAIVPLVLDAGLLAEANLGPRYNFPLRIDSCRSVLTAR